MPAGDGIELLTKIRAGEAGNHSSIPVILMTGFSYYLVKDLMALGANRVIAKPFSIEDLIKIISGTLVARSD
jgi:CheY-like chemotaxis protein